MKIETYAIEYYYYYKAAAASSFVFLSMRYLLSEFDPFLTILVSLNLNAFCVEDEKKFKKDGKFFHLVIDLLCTNFYMLRMIAAISWKMLIVAFQDAEFW